MGRHGLFFNESLLALSVIQYDCQLFGYTNVTVGNRLDRMVVAKTLRVGDVM